jgi:hypothetical protein
VRSVVAQQNPGLPEASFDDQDRDLFTVDNPRLRADALRYSLLPRLHIALRECLNAVKLVYNIEPLEHSRLARYPNFREQRASDLRYLYESAFSGIGGKFRKEGWPGFERKRGNSVAQILPFRYGLNLSQDGLSVLLENGWLTGLSKESYNKLYDFHLEHEEIIQSLAYQGYFMPLLFIGRDLDPVAPFSKQYSAMRDDGQINNNWETIPRGYPVDENKLLEIIHAFVAFFPVYDSYIQIARGEPIRFVALVESLNHFLSAETPSDDQEPIGSQKLYADTSTMQTRKLAEKRVPVLPGWRWQVFQRDGWKCVACGQDASHGVLLHVDHIVPRSLGGQNELGNYQTLCHICNIGKSNRDATDLRHSGSR